MVLPWALQDERVVSALLLNPRAFFWDPSLDKMRELRAGLHSSELWRRAAHGDASVARVLALLQWSPKAPLTFARRALERRRTRRLGGDRVDQALDSLRDSGKTLMLAFSGDEPLYDELVRDGHLKRLDRWPNITLELLPGLHHSLRELGAQQAAHRAIDSAIKRELEREPVTDEAGRQRTSAHTTAGGLARRDVTPAVRSAEHEKLLLNGGDLEADANLEPQPHSSRILANASFRAIADIGSKIATAALYLIVARKVGASQFGVLVFAMSFAGLVLTLGQFGQDFALVRAVARDRQVLDEYYSHVLLSRILMAVPPLLIALTIASLTGMSAQTRLVILLMGIGFICDSLIQVSFAVFQAFERVALMPTVLITQRWVTSGVAIFILYRGAGIVGVAAVYAVGAGLAACFAAWLLYRRIARNPG